MGHDVLFEASVLLGILWLCMLLRWAWRRVRPTTWYSTPTPATPIQRHSPEPKPFPGLIHKPCCDACEHTMASHPQVPAAPPPLLTFPRGRRRAIDAPQQFCPDRACAYYGWVGRGNIRANGHPGGQPWRQFQCVSCHGYFSERHGTIFHGKRASDDLIVRVIACLAEGLGIRGAARVFEVDPNTVLQWLVEAAEQLRAFSPYFLHDLPLRQVQLDELYAVLSAIKDG